MKALTIDWNLCGGASGASNKGNGGEGVVLVCQLQQMMFILKAAHQLWLLTKLLSVHELPRSIKFQL